MAPNTVPDFENLSFNTFNAGNFPAVSDSSDPNVNFFNSIPNEQTKCFSVDNITSEMNSSEKEALSILHLNLRSLNKNFENLKTFFAELRLGFQIICLTSLNPCVLMIPKTKKLMGYQVTLVCIKSRIMDKVDGGEERECKICVFLNDSLIFKLRPDLSRNNEEMEAFSLEFIDKKSKNILTSVQYRHPSNKAKIFEEYLQSFPAKPKQQINQPILKSFVNLLLQNNCISLVLKPRKISKTNATIIDYINTSNSLQTD